MFRAAHRSSSEALNCICNLWFDPFPTQPWQRPVTTWVYKPEAENTVLSSWWWAVCRSKHVELSINFGIINSITKPHLVGISTEYFSYNKLTLDPYSFFLKVKLSRVSNKNKMAALSMKCLYAAPGRGVNRNLNIRGNLINKCTLLEHRTEPEVPVHLSLVASKLCNKSQWRFCA